MEKIENKRKYIRENYSQVGHPTDRFLKLSENDICYAPNPSAFVKKDEYTKDKNRILFSRSFRRLEHKAQIYTHEKGDHYRNRLTHSLEVLQIAKSMARNVGLNEDLTEAITLGHDIGHTPFGHAGEKTLDNIMSGETDLDRTLKYKINYGGFKHNFQGIKTLDILERRFESIKGLNLTWQVLDGILKHTKTRKCDGPFCTCGKCWDLSRFIQDKNDLNKFPQLNFSCTLEGQIVAISDEIAQRQHDIDDGLRAEDTKRFIYKKVIPTIISSIEEIELKYNKDSEEIISLLALKHKLKSRSASVDVKVEICRRDALIKDITEYFIIDASQFSLDNIFNDQIDSLKFWKGKKYVNKNLIKFSNSGADMCNKIKKIIDSEILGSDEVNSFDKEAESKIEMLFKIYYYNPNLLTKYALFRLDTRVKNNYDKIYNLKFSDDMPMDKNYLENESKYTQKFINVLKLDIKFDELQTDKSWHLTSSKLNDLLFSINKKSQDKISNDKELFIKCILENHYAFLSTICDDISGMTDNYAEIQILKNQPRFNELT